MELYDVKVLARELMNKHGLDHWRVELINSKSVAGRCWTKFWSNVPQNSIGVIQLSVDYMKVFDEDEVMETILHEIAHALVNPKLKAHGPEWKAKARSIGSTGARVVRKDAPRPESKWTGICRGAGCEYRKHRLTNSRRYTSYCPSCSKRGMPVVRIDWYETVTLKGRNKPKAPVVTSVASLRAVQVVKKELSWKEKFDRGMTEIEW